MRWLGGIIDSMDMSFSNPGVDDGQKRKEGRERVREGERKERKKAVCEEPSITSLL